MRDIRPFRQFPEHHPDRVKSRICDSTRSQIGVFFGHGVYIEGHARDQALLLLLPASVEDYVSADNPVRFIDALVDDLDLGDAGFLRSRPKATGRPGYDPGDMLKLYLYGHLNRVRSPTTFPASLSEIANACSTHSIKAIHHGIAKRVAQASASVSSAALQPSTAVGSRWAMPQLAEPSPHYDCLVHDPGNACSPNPVIAETRLTPRTHPRGSGSAEAGLCHQTD